MTYGVSSSLYVATNAYGLSQNSFIGSAAWQCIGFETGAASGAQLGSGKRAWTVAGDGGFMMVCQSLSTLARNKLNAVIFVISNAVYAIEQVYVDITAFEPGPEHKFDTFDILPKWDYLALARRSAPRAIALQTVSELNAVLARTQRALTDQPALVEVVIPEKDLPRTDAPAGRGIDFMAKTYSIFGAGAAGLYTAWRLLDGKTDGDKHKAKQLASRATRSSSTIGASTTSRKSIRGTPRRRRARLHLALPGRSRATPISNWAACAIPTGTGTIAVTGRRTSRGHHGDQAARARQIFGAVQRVDQSAVLPAHQEHVSDRHHVGHSRALPRRPLRRRRFSRHRIQYWWRRSPARQKTLPQTRAAWCEFYQNGTHRRRPAGGFGVPAGRAASRTSATGT